MAVSGAGPAASPVPVRGRRDTGALSTLCSACEAVGALGGRVAPRSPGQGLSPSAGSSREFGLQLLVATALSMARESSRREND